MDASANGDNIKELDGLAEASAIPLGMRGIGGIPYRLRLQQTSESLVCCLEMTWLGFELECPVQEYGKEVELEKREKPRKTAEEFFQSFGTFPEGSPLTDLLLCGGRVRSFRSYYDVQVIEGWKEESEKGNPLALYFAGLRTRTPAPLAIKLYGAEFLCPWDDEPGVHRRSLPNDWLIRRSSSGDSLDQIRLDSVGKCFAALLYVPGRGFCANWFFLSREAVQIGGLKGFLNPNSRPRVTLPGDSESPGITPSSNSVPAAGFTESSPSSEDATEPAEDSGIPVIPESPSPDVSGDSVPSSGSAGPLPSSASNEENATPAFPVVRWVSNGSDELQRQLDEHQRRLDEQQRWLEKKKQAFYSLVDRLEPGFDETSMVIYPGEIKYPSSDYVFTLVRGMDVNGGRFVSFREPYVLKEGRKDLSVYFDSPCRLVTRMESLAFRMESLAFRDSREDGMWDSEGWSIIDESVVKTMLEKEFVARVSDFLKVELSSSQGLRVALWDCLDFCCCFESSWMRSLRNLNLSLGWLSQKEALVRKWITGKNLASILANGAGSSDYNYCSKFDGGFPIDKALARRQALDLAKAVLALHTLGYAYGSVRCEDVV
ncbi:MAG: hypothetical protein LBD54_03490 [Puniceicoccales bacterium]|nr:hypothetical protein [Puniceicoccales bacterium]